MTPVQIKILMLQKGLTIQKIADEIGARREVVSQLLNGHNYYPRHAAKVKELYGIELHDFRVHRRTTKQAA